QVRRSADAPTARRRARASLENVASAQITCSSAQLDPDEVAEVLALTQAAGDADGAYPLSEHVVLHLRMGGDAPAVHLFARADGRWDPRPSTPPTPSRAPRPSWPCTRCTAAGAPAGRWSRPRWRWPTSGPTAGSGCGRTATIRRLPRSRSAWASAVHVSSSRC